MGAPERIEDARFLWGQGRRGSGLLLVCAAVAARARREYPEAGDGFRLLIRASLACELSVEFRGDRRPIEQLLYRWVRWELMHTATVPLDIEIDDSLGEGLTVRAGGAPEYLLKFPPTGSTSWPPSQPRTKPILTTRASVGSCR